MRRFPGWMLAAFAAVLFLIPASGLSAPGFVAAPTVPVNVMPQTRWCVSGDGATCTLSASWDFGDFRQILVLPAGYRAEDEGLFREDFDTLVERMSNEGRETFTSVHRDLFLYVGAWIPGASLASGEANFGARIAKHPLRGKALSIASAEVFGAVEDLQAENAAVEPFGVVILFNTNEEDITENAISPGYTEKGYGIANVTRASLGDAYVGIHELAHAALNFQDEYVENGFAEMNIRSLDVLTPFVLFDGSWGSWVDAVQNLTGVFSVAVSEVLAAGGNDNIDVTKYPSRVATSGVAGNAYEYEGGMFFGRGTWHDRGDNIMNSDVVMRSADDGFAFAHSASQRGVVQQAMEKPAVAARPNDRIRNAGPLKPWGVSWGSSVRALMFDADKHHAFHPTVAYDVQVSWDERTWDVCYQWGFIPYPCYEEERRTVQKKVAPGKRYLNLKTSKLKGLASLVQRTLCSVGITEIGSGGASVDLCSMSVDEMMSTTLPAIRFPMPYQDVSIPTDQKMTKYKWRFRTTNGTFASGWTGWASFYKVF